MRFQTDAGLLQDGAWGCFHEMHLVEPLTGCLRGVLKRIRDLHRRRLVIVPQMPLIGKWEIVRRRWWWFRGRVFCPKGTLCRRSFACCDHPLTWASPEGEGTCFGSSGWKSERGLDGLQRTETKRHLHAARPPTSSPAAGAPLQTERRRWPRRHSGRAPDRPWGCGRGNRNVPQSGGACRRLPRP